MDDDWTAITAFFASWAIAAAWIIGFYILVHPSVWLGWLDQLRDGLPDLAWFGVSSLLSVLP